MYYFYQGNARVREWEWERELRGWELGLRGWELGDGGRTDERTDGQDHNAASLTAHRQGQRNNPR